MSYFRKNIDAMAAYVPGEQPAPGTKVIKLNTNENPYPPSPAAMKALRELEGELLRRYPHPFAQRFRQTAGQVLGVPPDWILPANGSDDLLTMLFRACVAPGRKVAYAMPTYVLYRTLGQIQDAEIVEAQYDEEYNLPVDRLLEAGAALTLVASPNSPSGTAARLEDLDRLAAGLPGVLAVDEAYVDFAEADALSLARKRRNVIILRTLSKGYSMAGLRLGFGVADPVLLAGLAKVKDSYNVSATACALGAEAFADQDYKIANAGMVKASRAKLALSLTRLGFRVWPSQSNFLLARPPAGDAVRVYEALKARGILVRYFQQPRLDDKLRITVGSDAECDALVAELRKLLK